MLIGARVFHILRHVDGLRGDGDFVDALPRPLEIRTARPDHAQLRPGIPFAFIGSQRLGHGQRQRCGLGEALSPAKTGLHGSFILVNRVKTRDNVAQHKPSYKADDYTDGNAYHSASFGVSYRRCAVHGEQRRPPAATRM